MSNNEVGIAARLARQASASVISNCVVELWSKTAMCLHALEPDFPLYPKSVVKFVQDTRLPFLSYVSLYYSMCGKPFEGTTTALKMKTLVDIRHDLQHDKPEVHDEFSEQRVEKVIKWRNRLESLVGKDGLLWLPDCRGKGKPSSFGMGGEPPIMKFMKYAVAKWADEATTEACKEMHEMLFAYSGKINLVPYDSLPSRDSRISTDAELLRLWQSGE